MDFSNMFIRYLIRFIGGGLLAALTIWGLGTIFLTSPSLFQYDQNLGFAARAADTYKQERTENWVTNTFGEHGLETHELARFHSAKPKYVIYGDSYIEAAMISGGKRIQDLFKKNNIDMVSMGYSGIGLPEYCFLMKIMPCLIDNLQCHILFVGDVYDFIGINPEICDGNYIGGLPQKSSTKLDIISSQYRLFFFRAIMRRWRLCKFDWLGNNWLKPVVSTQNSPLSNLDELCQKAKCQAQKQNIPLIIVYAPTIPVISGNKVMFNASEADFGKKLASSCRKNQIGFLDLGQEFCTYYRNTGKFPRGFFNTPPGQGHLNEAGHAIAAQALSKYFQEVR